MKTRLIHFLAIVVTLVWLSATSPVQATTLDGQTVATTNFHGSQPDQTTIFGPVESVVGPGVELTNFGVTVWVNGQPQPGVFNIDFSDTNVLITLNADQPFGYFEVLRFSDANGTILGFTEVTINPATNWNGFNESDIFVSAEFFQVNLTALYGEVGQQISLDLPAVSCEGDLNGDHGVGPNDLAILLGAWGPNLGHAADLNDDGVVDAADLAQLLGNWGPCE